MEKIIAYIERGKDERYSIYMEDSPLNYTIIGDGPIVKEAMEDFYNSYEEMKDCFKEREEEFTEVEFVFKYDLASFLSYYSGKLSLVGLERITGVNQGQLSHYITGHRKPSQKTVVKIEESLHNFANELNQIHFV